jgi:hypothetical protein
VIAARRVCRRTFASDEVASARGIRIAASESPSTSIEIATLVWTTCLFRCRAPATYKVACTFCVLGKPVKLARTPIEIAVLMRSACCICRCALAPYKIACTLRVLGKSVKLARTPIEIAVLMRSACRICRCALAPFSCSTDADGVLCQTSECPCTAVCVTTLSCRPTSRTCWGSSTNTTCDGAVKIRHDINRTDAGLGDGLGRSSWPCAHTSIYAISVGCVKVYSKSLSFW